MDSFAIRWTYSIETQKRFLLWEYGLRVIYFTFVLKINSDDIPSVDTEWCAISLSELEASVEGDGRYCIFTCSGCGYAGCVSLSPVEVVHINGSTLWDDLSYLQASYEFESASYCDNILRLSRQVKQLAQQYPNHTFQPPLW